MTITGNHTTPPAQAQVTPRPTAADLHDVAVLGTLAGQAGLSPLATRALMAKIEAAATTAARTAALAALPEVLQLVLQERAATTNRIAAGIAADSWPFSAHYAQVAQRLGATAPPGQY